MWIGIGVYALYDAFRSFGKKEFVKIGIIGGAGLILFAAMLQLHKLACGLSAAPRAQNFNIRQIDDRIHEYISNMGGLLEEERELTDVQKIFNLNEQFYVMLLTEKVTASIAKASQESDYAVLDTPRRSGPAIKPRKRGFNKGPKTSSIKKLGLGT